MKSADLNSIGKFYNEFWPNNVPNYLENKKYILQTLSGRKYKRALDAGCGHGISAIVLSEFSEQVVAVDISEASIETARSQGYLAGRSNISYQVQNLESFSATDGEFDLVWCWGVAMMTPEPLAVIQQLFRVTSRGGELYLGLYLKTWLSPVHEIIRRFCRAFMGTPRRKRFVLDLFAWLTSAIVSIRGKEVNMRADNVSIQAQVDDWYYPPYKTFYSISEIVGLFEMNGFEALCIQDRVGRMRSATIFVVKGVKR
jgi:2-polyprenyl-6-hydroxyphenyl methylase/3-demethylubiquinone-9 3-methyltransferase